MMFLQVIILLAGFLFLVKGADWFVEVTNFLYKIKFPFTIGYGMTECGQIGRAHV